MSADELPLLVVVGATASGKTELAVRLAERCDGEVVSADSVQVYRHFDVGSGKPTTEQLARAPHHLIDIVEPTEALEAARWAELATETLTEIRARGRRPIVCGGTFLWVRALLFGLADAPPGDPDIRREHTRIAELNGRDALHRMLSEVDPVSATRLHPNDFVRVSRALEVHQLSGRPLSALQEEHGFREPLHRATLLGLAHPPATLDARILERCQGMFRSGWIDEVRTLLARGFGESRPMGAVGYRQIREALEGEAPLDTETLEQTVYRATRVFARRQRTWLRDEPVTWLSPDEITEARLDALLAGVPTDRKSGVPSR